MSEGTVPSGVAPGAVPGMPAQSEEAWARPGSVPSASTAPPRVPPPPGAPLGPPPDTTHGPVGYGPGVVPGEGPSGAPGGGATGAGALEVEGSEPGRAQPSSDCAGMPGTAPGATPLGTVPSLI